MKKYCSPEVKKLSHVANSARFSDRTHPLFSRGGRAEGARCPTGSPSRSWGARRRARSSRTCDTGGPRTRESSAGRSRLPRPPRSARAGPRPPSRRDGSTSYFSDPNACRGTGTERSRPGRCPATDGRRDEGTRSARPGRRRGTRRRTGAPHHRTLSSGVFVLVRACVQCRSICHGSRPRGSSWTREPRRRPRRARGGTAPWFTGRGETISAVLNDPRAGRTSRQNLCGTCIRDAV
eukprot:jgi/Mesvir1/14652/Mv26249-RA.1